jgi:hypothetical protein
MCLADNNESHGENPREALDGLQKKCIIRRERVRNFLHGNGVTVKIRFV